MCIWRRIVHATARVLLFEGQIQITPQHTTQKPLSQQYMSSFNGYISGSMIIVVVIHTMSEVLNYWCTNFKSKEFCHFRHFLHYKVHWKSLRGWYPAITGFGGLIWIVLHYPKREQTLFIHLFFRDGSQQKKTFKTVRQTQW